MASLRVGSLFGIPIKLGASFLLVLPLLAYLIGTQVTPTVDLLNQVFGTAIDPGELTDGTLPWLLGVSAALGLFVSVLLHELGHSLVARRYGLEIESITLWFLGGLAQFTEFPEDWREELTIAVAGPIVSVVPRGRLLRSLRRAPGRSCRPRCSSSATSPSSTSSSPRSTCYQGSRWTAAGCCARCSPGTGLASRPRASLPPSARGSPSFSVSPVSSRSTSSGS